MNPNEIAAAVPDWELGDDGIRRTFSTPDYGTAMALTVRIGLEAQRRNHHPEITVGWGSVAVSLVTHDAGDSVTDKDVELARWIDEAASN